MKTLAVNPVLPNWEYLPDAEPRVFGGRLYLYGSHDRFGGTGFCLNSYVGWSAPVDDPGNWRFEGPLLDVRTDPANRDGRQTGFAPDCVQGPDGRYYFYYCLNGTSRFSVAVSDRPAGPFSFAGYVCYPDGQALGEADSVFAFDPGVLTASDGRIWLYTGFGPSGGGMLENLRRQGKRPGGFCVELERDMLTVKSEARQVLPCALDAAGTGFEGHAFFEASSPREILGRYYLLYSSQLSHELCYAVSDRPDGGFVYGGTVVSNGDIGLDGNTVPRNYMGNTHGGLVKLGERWYVFYHRQTNQCHYCRQCCAEPIELRPDGSIAQAELTSCGLNGGPLPARGSYSASIACNLSAAEGALFYGLEMRRYPGHPCFTQSGADREKDGDQYIAGLVDGSWCAFKYLHFDGAERKLTLRLRCGGAGTVVVSRTRDGTPLTRIDYRPCADWTPFTGELCAPVGTTALYFTWHGSGETDFSAFEIV